jgi:hypothetical protein
MWPNYVEKLHLHYADELLERQARLRAEAALLRRAGGGGEGGLEDSEDEEAAAAHAPGGWGAAALRGWAWGRGACAGWGIGQEGDAVAAACMRQVEEGRAAKARTRLREPLPFIGTAPVQCLGAS